MLSIRTTAIVGSLSLAIVAFGADKLTKQLETNYAAITAAFKKKDIDKIGSFLAPDFKALNSDGSSAGNREEILKQYKAQMGQIKDLVWIRKIKNLVKQPDKSVLVTIEGHVTGTVPGTEKKPQKFELMATAKDTWIDTGKGWAIKSTTIVKKEMLIDGKPVKTGG